MATLYKVKVWGIPYWSSRDRTLDVGDRVRFLVGIFGHTGEICPVGGSIDEKIKYFNSLEGNVEKNRILIRNMHREMREEAGITDIDLHTHQNVPTYCYRWKDHVYTCNAAVCFIDISNLVSSMEEESCFLVKTNASGFRDNELSRTMFVTRNTLNVTQTDRIWPIFRYFVNSRSFSVACGRIKHQNYEA
eukprot:gene29470-5817_t